MATTLNHVMVDLETLGTVPGCVGFSIGAVQFHPGRNELGSTFYAVVNVDSALDHLLREEEATRDWWAQQSAEARATLEDARAGKGMSLPDAMRGLNSFLLGLGGMRSLRLYGNGADFDNPILRVMWDASGVKMLDSDAGFFGGRCYRTLKSLDELFGSDFAFDRISRQGTYHNALDDAKSQAQHLMANIARIRQHLLAVAMKGEV